MDLSPAIMSDDDTLDEESRRNNHSSGGMDGMRCGHPTNTMTTVVGMMLLMVANPAMMSVNADPLYSLHPPDVYKLFMGTLDIGYRIPANVSLPHAFVRLDYLGKSPETSEMITTMGLTLGRKSGTVTFACGLLEFAGVYTLRMYTRVQGKVLATAKVKVIWPDVVLSLPDTHRAQTVNVEVRVLSHAACPSLLHRFPMHTKLLFQRNIPNGAKELNRSNNISTSEFSSLTKPFTTLTLSCHLFDVDGSYQAVVESSAAESPLVARSNVMTVRWSGQYFLTFPSETVFPCKDSVTITYSHPPCSMVDKIRVFSLHRPVEGSLASPLQRTYLTERGAVPSKNKMVFACGMFNKSASGFEFIYVSVTRNLTIYTKQTLLRVSAWPDSVFPVDGAWSQWSSWSACSVSCGQGKASRVRLCDKPAPKHGGMFCPGKPFQWKPCSQDCDDFTPVSPLQSPTFDTECYCGCTKTDLSGEIIATGRCYGLSTWVIEAASEDWVVSLTFGYFSLNYTMQTVRVKDGSSSSDVVVFSSLDTGYPVEIISSGRSLRVELTTDYTTPPTHVLPQEATLPIHAQGFVARYQLTNKASSNGTVSPVLFPYEEQTVMGSTVTILGIVLCVIIILAAVVFVILQRTFLQRKVKYTSAPVGGSPAHGLALTQSDNHLSSNHHHSKRHSHLSSSQHSSSNASSPDAATIFVDMEKPLTGKNHKPDAGGKHKSSRHQSKSSRASSTSSIHSQKKKLLQPFTSSDTSSPKPGSKAYRAGMGAGGIEVMDTDELNGDKTNPASKSLRPNVQFVQKNSPTNTSPNVSKFDLLKRKDRKCSKSSCQEKATGVSSDASSTVSTTKAEVNWPQSSFVKSALNEMGKTFYDRHRPGQRPLSEEIPLIDTSSKESPSHVNNLVKSESTDSTASSILQENPSKARRPTSLTESYSSVQSKCDELTISESPCEADTGTLKRGDGFKPYQSHSPSSSITPTSRLHSNVTPVLKSPSPTISKTPCAILTPSQHPPILTPSQHPPILTPSQHPSILTPSQHPSILTPSHILQPPPISPLQIIIPDHNPKPKVTTDSHKSSLSNVHIQSPKSSQLSCPESQNQRLRHIEAASPSVISKCSSHGSKTTISSPARSITTPSETEGLELEYDDFIEDDPLSYFDYEETQKLAFRGSEKIGRTPIEEDEEEDSCHH